MPDIDEIQKKLDYIGLNLSKIPKILKNEEPLEFRIPKFYDDKKYRQYKYVSVKDIQILISPTNRLESLEERYKKAVPLKEFLDSKTEKNSDRHADFLTMLANVSIEDVKKIEQEQEQLNKTIPFKVKFDSSHLWQIYYSENTDKYFMIVSIEDINHSTFFYIIKKQLEKGRSAKIFVPIKNLNYSNEILSKQQIEDIENYTWIFAKDWPYIYDVFDKNNNMSIHIYGETEVYEKIKSSYKLILENEQDANKFYKLLKALFIIQTELPSYFKFKTKVNASGGLEFVINGQKIEFDTISNFINEEYEKGIDRIIETKQLSDENNLKIDNLKRESVLKDAEYIMKEKQISTFLECKRTFFGKFKYYFKYSKKVKSKNKEKINDKKELEDSNIEQLEKDRINSIVENKKQVRHKKSDEKLNHTLEELLQIYKDLEKREIELKNIVMDINALKLKIKNTNKKIENASLFIEEIDGHKKSIFEFWKYTNKDQMSVLPEGEKEEVNIIRTIERTFDYEDDFEKFARGMDKVQRKTLNKEETDAIYITNTNVIDIINENKTDVATFEKLEIMLNKLKQEATDAKVLTENEEFDIFGGIVQDNTKITKINNKEHRELPKDKFSILDITKVATTASFELKLDMIKDSIKKALSKISLKEEIIVYKALGKKQLIKENINIFNLNPEKELQDAIDSEENEINLYKLTIPKGINAISMTNIIFFDNQNKTLPIGQDISTKIILDISNSELELKNQDVFKVTKIQKEENTNKDFKIKKINVFEYVVKIQEKV